MQNRIVETSDEPIDSILFNPSNWRVHPARQQDAVRESLLKVGWVEAVMVNLRTSEEWPPGERNVKTLVDGHMRVLIAARNGEKTVPVTYVDLTPEEEDYVLSTLDPLGGLAATDANKLMELVSRQKEQTPAILAAMRGAGLDGRKKIVPDQDDPPPAVQEDQKPRSDDRDRERYPLAIVLDRQGYEMWQTWKNSQGLSRDTDALKALLSKAIAVFQT